MKAVGYRRNLPVAHDESLIDLDLPVPEPGPHDLRVAVKAVSVNPVDTKQRARATPPEGGCGTEPARRAARGIDDDQARGFSCISHVSMTSPSLMSLNDPRPMPHS